MVMVGKSRAVYRAALHSFFSTYPVDINIILQLILYPQHYCCMQLYTYWTATLLGLMQGLNQSYMSMKTAFYPLPQFFCFCKN